MQNNSVSGNGDEEYTINRHESVATVEDARRVTVNSHWSIYEQMGPVYAKTDDDFRKFDTFLTMLAGGDGKCNHRSAGRGLCENLVGNVNHGSQVILNDEDGNIIGTFHPLYFHTCEIGVDEKNTPMCKAVCMWCARVMDEKMFITLKTVPLDKLMVSEKFVPRFKCITQSCQNTIARGTRKWCQKCSKAHYRSKREAKSQ
jgi:hypothetical protein